jgi:hypothetical protein
MKTILLFFCYKYEEEEEDLGLKEEKFLILILCNISDLLTGILVLIAKQLMKSKEKEEVKERHQSKYKLIYNDNFAMKKSTIILIALISVFYFISESKGFFFSLTVKPPAELVITN